MLAALHGVPWSYPVRFSFVSALCSSSSRSATATSVMPAMNSPERAGSNPATMGPKTPHEPENEGPCATRSDVGSSFRPLHGLFAPIVLMAR